MNQYLNVKAAAVYCGYSPAYFPRVICEYLIPRYGPKRNKIKISDLDLWMKNPEIFRPTVEPLNTGFRMVR